MLKIAVCDDDPHERDSVRETLTSHFASGPGIHSAVIGFSSCEELLAEVEQNGDFDLYLLDVVLPGMDGIAFGKRLREMGSTAEIVYLTRYEDFAVDSYDVQAFFYLVKPVPEERLLAVVDKAIAKLMQRPDRSMMVSTMSGPQRIALGDIRYVERFGRRVRYHCVNGVIDSRTIRVPFKVAVAELSDDLRFLQCGASYLVNLQHVDRVAGCEVQFDSGETVTVPRTSAPALKHAWEAFWFNAGRLAPDEPAHLHEEGDEGPAEA